MIGDRMLMTVLYFEVFLYLKIYGDAVGLTNNHKSKLTEYFVQHGVDCLATNTLSADDVKALQTFNVPKGRKSACFFACVLKKAEMLDAEGRISTGKVLNVAKNVFDNEEELKAAVSVFQHCDYGSMTFDDPNNFFHFYRITFILEPFALRIFYECAIDKIVNDLEVNDGNEGCDRAKFILICIMDQCNRDMTSGKLTALSDTNAKFGLRNIVQSVLEGFLRLACLGLSKDFLPGRIIAKLLPGLETVSVPCAFYLENITLIRRFINM